MPKSSPHVDKKEVEQMHRMTKYVIGGCLLMFVLVILGCHSCMKDYKNDNPAEQLLESIIKKETGIAIDLSPGE